MNEATLRDRLLATVPAVDDSDWLDVRRRARAIEAPRRRSRRLLAIAAVLAILTALVANPALGIGERLLDFVEGDPAPEDVKQSIGSAIPYGRIVLGEPEIRFERTPPPEVARARLAIRLDSSLGPVYLWAAPAEGGACTSLEIVSFEERSGPLCDSAPTAENQITNFKLGPSVVLNRERNFTSGRVGAQVGRLEVDLSDGQVAELRLVEGFFLAEFPTYKLSERSTGCMRFSDWTTSGSGLDTSTSCFAVPTEYRGFDADGRLVMRVSSGLASVPPTAGPNTPPQRAIGIELSSGRSARIEADGPCWRLIWDTGLLDLDNGNGSCSSVGPRDLPFRMLYGSPVDERLVLLHGPVGSDIAQVDLVWSDDTSERLRLENGFVLKEIDPDAARQPAKLVGRDASGQVVAEEAVR
jgi:hypothetical protein